MTLGSFIVKKKKKWFTDISQLLSFSTDIHGGTKTCHELHNDLGMNEILLVGLITGNVSFNEGSHVGLNRGITLIGRISCWKSCENDLHRFHSSLNSTHIITPYS